MPLGPPRAAEKKNPNFLKLVRIFSIITLLYYYIIIKQNGHETDLEMSPGPLDTTIFEKKCIRTMGKWSYRSEPGFKIGL